MGGKIEILFKVLEEHQEVNSEETELICCQLIEKWADESLGLNENFEWKNLISYEDLFRKDWTRTINVLDYTYRRLGKDLFSVKVGWDINLLNVTVL